MPEAVRETTNPATEEFGMRTFEVYLSPTQIIEIAIHQRVASDCSAEIHSTNDLLLSVDPVKDEDLDRALALLFESRM